jgi:hypothetical protein
MDPKIVPEGYTFKASRLMIDTNTLNERTRTFMKENEISLQPYNVNLDYDYFSVGTYHFHHI